jgi:hypothetical protein
MYAAKRARRRRTRRPPAQTDPVQLALLHEQAAVAGEPEVVLPIVQRPSLVQVPGQGGPSPAS